MLQNEIILNKEFQAFIKPYRDGDNKYYLPSFPNYFYSEGLRKVLQDYPIYTLLEEDIFPFFDLHAEKYFSLAKINISALNGFAFNYCLVITDQKDNILTQKRVYLNVERFSSLTLIMFPNHLILPEENLIYNLTS